MKKIKYEKNQMVGSLRYIKDSEPFISPSRKSRGAFFQCQCGVIFRAIIRSAVTGNTKSCGCFGALSRKERFTKHGKRNHPIYSVWCGIKTRCYNKNRADYKYYGGRGIVMSEEFVNSFQVFYDYVRNLDLYEKRDLERLTIDRIDNYKGYERGNLRWATRAQQSKNRR